MTTVAEVARRVLSDVASDAGHPLAALWVAERYEKAMTRFRPRQLRQRGELVQPGTLATGTITVAQGSDQVVPDATALALWQPLTQLVGRSFRCQDAEWYAIKAVDPVTGTLTLQSPYVIVGGSGLGYEIAARFLPLAPNARWLGVFVHMRLWQQLRGPIPADALDAEDPARTWSQGVPGCVADVGTTLVNGKEVRLVEIYPYAKVDELIHYTYWSLPLTLKLNDEIPTFLPSYTLKDGALVNAMRYKAGQAVSAGKLEEAAYWRNEYRSQETMWSKSLDDIARSDRGADDITFLLRGYSRSWRGWDGTIMTAHDEAWARSGGP